MGSYGRHDGRRYEQLDEQSFCISYVPGFAITQGFSSTAFQAQQDKCDILRAGQDNTQRIIDTLNNHWKDEQALKIQDLKFELSQERQNNLINERFNRLGNCGCGGNSCGCGCGQ